MLIENLHRRSNLDIDKLKLIASTSSRRYKVYQIPKRDGTLRTIEHPSKELKAIQRWLIKAIARDLPIHPHATAYKKGARIVNNASAHIHSNYTIRLDFSNFFPSFTKKNVIDFLNEINSANNFQFTDEDIEFSACIFTRYEKLTIGAPSSPTLTNAMMYDFDRVAAIFATNNGITYTRYADDMFFSSVDRNSLTQVEKFIDQSAKSYKYATLTLNKSKTTHLSRKYKRAITGLILTPERKISIGRDRKREIKALLHRYKNATLAPELSAWLMGLVAFAADAEPNFFTALSRKYGQNILDKILNK